MKDSEFIELLNLYLDHEISAADAARLEAEVQTNLKRRRIYQQYCRMQKACKLVAADFQNESDTAAVSDKKVVAFSPVASGTEADHARGGRTAGFYTWGTFAAVAACVAIVFVGHGRQEALDNTPGAIAAPAIAQTPAPIPNVQPAVAIESPAPRALAQRPQATIFSNPLLLTGNAQAQALFSAAVDQADNQLAWLQTVKLAPVQTPMQSDDNLHFAAKLQTEGRALGNRAGRQHEPADEAVSFQFVK